MTHVFPRHCHVSPPIAKSGDGCFLIDQTGKRYFDGSGGAAVSCGGGGCYTAFGGSGIVQADVSAGLIFMF